MKALHIILSLMGFVGSTLGIALQDRMTPMLACALLLAASILQIPAIFMSARKSFFFKLRISHISMILLLTNTALCGLVLLGLDAAIYFFPVTLAASILALIPAVNATDFDPTGEDFVAALTESLETISRATAERQCGYDTQILYERARFCEPVPDPAVRQTEREILRRILELKPYDSDAEISAKCAAVSELIDRREKITQ